MSTQLLVNEIFRDIPNFGMYPTLPQEPEGEDAPPVHVTVRNQETQFNASLSSLKRPTSVNSSMPLTNKQSGKLDGRSLKSVTQLTQQTSQSFYNRNNIRGQYVRFKQKQFLAQAH